MSESAEFLFPQGRKSIRHGRREQAKLSENIVCVAHDGTIQRRPGPRSDLKIVQDDRDGRLVVLPCPNAHRFSRLDSPSDGSPTGQQGSDFRAGELRALEPSRMQPATDRVSASDQCRNTGGRRRTRSTQARVALVQTGLSFVGFWPCCSGGTNTCQVSGGKLSQAKTSLHRQQSCWRPNERTHGDSSRS